MRAAAAAKENKKKKQSEAKTEETTQSQKTQELVPVTEGNASDAASDGADDNGSIGSQESEKVDQSETDLASQLSDDLSDDGDASVAVTINNSSSQANKKVSPLHRKILDALVSSTALSPVQVDVRNESYWYRERSRLGPRKHNALAVKQNSKTGAWEAYLFKLRPRDSDGEFVPTKTIVSRHKSKWLAYKHCEQGAKLRDCCPTENKKLAASVDLDRLLNTHFRITIVSDRFYRMNSVERIALVYDEILKKVGEPVLLPPSSAPSSSSLAVTQRALSSAGGGPGSPISPMGTPKSKRTSHKIHSPTASSSLLPSPMAAGGQGILSLSPQQQRKSSRPTSHQSHGRAQSLSPPPSRGSPSNDFGGTRISPSNKGSPNSKDSPSGSQRKQSRASFDLTQPRRQYSMSNCLPERNKIGSIFGANMCALDVFRHISTDQPFTLVVEAKTPSQWKPSIYEPLPSEHFHMSHMEMTSLQIPLSVQPLAHRNRIKILAKSFTDEAILAASYAKQEKRPSSTAATTAVADNGIKNASSSSSVKSTSSHVTASSREMRGLFAGGTGPGVTLEATAIATLEGGMDLSKKTGEHTDDIAALTVVVPSSSSVKFSGGTGTGLGSTGLGTGVGMDGNKKKEKKKKPPPVPLAERLGVDPLLLPAASGGMRVVPGTGLVRRKKPKLGGVYGHFFHELPPVVREMIMERVKHNKKRIQKESFLTPEEIAKLKKKALRRENRDGEMDFTVDMEGFDAAVAAAASGRELGPPKDSFQPVTKFSKMRAKAAAAVGPSYDCGTNTEHEMIEEIYIAAQKIEKVAVRIQRMRRACLFRRAARLLWRTKYAALTIQRVARGRFGRLYFALCKKLYPLAASRIQWAFRSVKTRFLIRKWRFLVFRMTRTVLPLIKRFINNILTRMQARRREDYNATLIQSQIRMHLCRARYLKKLGDEIYFEELVVDSAVLIQKLFRGMMGRRRHREMYECLLKLRVDQPAALRIQRVYRGYLGRLLAELQRIRYAALLLLQKNIRAWVQRVWRARMRLEAKKFRCAVLIQKRYRGRMDRELVQFRREKRYYETVYLPAVVRVQGYIRRRQAMKKYATLLRQTDAAKKLQRRYRYYVKVCKSLEIWLQRQRVLRNLMACKMQKVIRGFFARLEFRRKYTIYRGKMIFAARVIMRAWMNFKFGRRFQMLMDKHRQKIYQDRVDRALAARDELLMDIDDIDIDIINTNELLGMRRTRIQDLEVFIQAAHLRIPYLEGQIKALSDEDAEKGWEESLVNEWSTLKNQLIMVREEIRLLRVDLRKRQEEVLLLNLELEEAYIELDAIGVLSMEAIEGLHRNELNIAEREVNNTWNRRIRLERCRWKIRNNRKNVIMRRLMKRYVQPARDMEFAETISYEKRQRVIDREKLTAQMRMAVARTRGEGVGIQKKVKTYEEYAGPMQDTYAGVVDNTLELLKGWSIDERAHRLKDETTLLAAVQRKGTKGQFAPIKDPKNAPPDAY